MAAGWWLAGWLAAGCWLLAAGWWLAGWLACWLAGWLAAWLAGWLNKIRATENHNIFLPQNMNKQVRAIEYQH